MLRKWRKRSAIVYPVLSDTNQLLGTLVALSDKTGFFMDRDGRFWERLLEVFSKRIALEKVKLDLLHTSLRGREISLSMEPPF